MSNEISISVVKASEAITIVGEPEGYAFTPSTTTGKFLVAEPNNDFSFTPEAGYNSYGINTFTDSSASIINVGSQVNITLGKEPENVFAKELDGFKYSFPNFVDSDTSTLSFGDVVYLESDLDSSANDWNAKCKKVDVSDINKGAFQALFIFISHQNNSLHLISKGFFDLEDVNFSPQWTAGRTIYLNSDNKLDITPSGVPGGWVRSLGFCIPNKDNKKRIWFEPDSTYIKMN